MLYVVDSSFEIWFYVIKKTNSIDIVLIIETIFQYFHWFDFTSILFLLKETSQLTILELHMIVSYQQNCQEQWSCITILLFV